MSNEDLDELIFVYIGTTNYHFLIERNIELLKRLYPKSPIIVYDWGDGHGQPSPTRFPSDVEVIDWSKRVRDTWDLMDVYSDARRVEIGKTYNSRMASSFSKRFTKFFLKRFPNSPTAKAAIAKGLEYENLLIHKSYNMMDCSKRLDGQRFFLLDADAYLVERIDEIYDGDPDIILPMIEPGTLRWDYNNCHGLSTGIMGFGADTASRDAFLDEWYEAIRLNDEWLRELAAVNRLIKGKSERFFDDWGLNSVRFGSHDVKLRTIKNEVYNRVYNYEFKPADITPVKILHLSGIAQQRHLFDEYIGEVEDELSKRHPDVVIAPSKDTP